MHQPRPPARQTNLYWEGHGNRLFLNHVWKQASSRVYPITTNHLTWAPKQPCEHINNGAPAQLCCPDLWILWQTQPCFDITLAGFMFWVYPTNWWPGTGEKPHRDPWRRRLRWEPKCFTRTNQQLLSRGKTSNATQVERGQNDPSAKQLEHIMIIFGKALTHSDRHGPGLQGSFVCPVQSHGNPRGETCSYQWADKWYELWSLC